MERTTLKKRRALQVQSYTKKHDRRLLRGGGAYVNSPSNAGCDLPATQQTDPYFVFRVRCDSFTASLSGTVLVPQGKLNELFCNLASLLLLLLTARRRATHPHKQTNFVPTGELVTQHKNYSPDPVVV